MSRTEAIVLTPWPTQAGLFILRPQDNHIVELELHGLQLVRIELEIEICNFESVDGSLAVFGTGEDWLASPLLQCAG